MALAAMSNGATSLQLDNDAEQLLEKGILEWSQTVIRQGLPWDRAKWKLELYLFAGATTASLLPESFATDVDHHAEAEQLTGCVVGLLTPR